MYKIKWFFLFIFFSEVDSENNSGSSKTTLLNTIPPLVLNGSGFPWDNKWTHTATRSLLDLYVKNEEKFKDPHTKKKQIWGEISEILRSKGFTFDAEKCERKFLNLKTVYRNNVQHNCMTGNHDRKCSFYDELEAIFHLSAKLKSTSNKKSNQKLPDVVEPKRVAQRDPSSETSTSPAKVVPVPVFLIPHDAKIPNEAEKSSFTSSVSSTSSQAPPHPRVNINPPPSGQISATSPRYRVQSPHANIGPRNRYHYQPHRSALKAAPGSPNIRSPLPQESSNRSPIHHNHAPSSGTAVIDLCNETADSLKRGASEIEARNDQSNAKKRRATDLQSLLESFENYRREQREREDQRMQHMKEMHDDEMKVTNRFLDIIHQYVQNGSN